MSGARQVSGSYQHNYYLKGATVIDVFEQQAGLAGDPADLSDRMRFSTSAPINSFRTPAFASKSAVWVSSCWR